MRARKNFSYLALLSLQSAPIPRKGKRPSLNLGDDTNFFAQFECAPLSSIIRRGVLGICSSSSQASGSLYQCVIEVLWVSKSTGENCKLLKPKNRRNELSTMPPWQTMTMVLPSCS